MLTTRCSFISFCKVLYATNPDQIPWILYFFNISLNKISHRFCNFDIGKKTQDLEENMMGRQKSTL
jgi:hypothetical protein